MTSLTNVVRNVMAFVRRHPILVAAATLLLLFRAALPVALRSLLVTKGSEAIEGRLEVGDVDLWLLRSGVALRKGAVFSAGGEARRLLAWDDLYTEISWIDLLRKTIRVLAIRLDAPSADIERLPDHSFNLTKLFRTQSPGSNQGVEPEKTPTEGNEKGTAERNTGWTVALDRLVIDHGQIRFRDLTVTDGEPIDIEIARLQVTQAASRRGVYDRAGRAELEARVLSAPLTLQAEVELDPQVQISSTANIQGLPVQHAMYYLPVSGWTDLRDEFGIPLTLALSLMSNVQGNITLDVPVSGDRKGTRLGLMDTVLSTLRRTILNALSSPLKLIGSVVLGEGKIEGLDVKPVSFEPGAEEPDSAGDSQQPCGRPRLARGHDPRAGTPHQRCPNRGHPALGASRRP
jgi:hypothetical protein